MDSYQAIYDAVRSKISGGDIGSIVESAARQAFDISHYVTVVQQEYLTAAYEAQRPFVLLKPRLFPDGNMWCVLYGDNIQDGLAAFGKTPYEAARQFDIEWLNQTCGMKENGAKK